MKGIYNYLFKKNPLSFPLVLSVVLHILFITSNFDFSSNSIMKSSPKKKYIEISLEKIKHLKKHGISKIKKKPKKSFVVGKQIVNNELTGKNKAPKDSRFLGEKNQTFDRQTVAQKNGIFKKAGVGTKTGNIQSDKKLKKKKLAMKKEIARKKRFEEVTLSDLSLSRKLSKVADSMKPRGRAKDSSGHVSAAALGLLRGDPSSRGLAENNDFVEDVPLGDVTNFNTTEFKYYGFYHRIRKKLEQHWNASLKNQTNRLFKAGRRLPANENFLTALKIVINKKGVIVKVNIETTSGYRELDAAAIDSFNKAGPFPNPPKGMLKNGTAEIKWGFVVKS